jgi:ABC-type bacteriocin/lantibiotic exporter with double-glycine peptidase domain
MTFGLAPLVLAGVLGGLPIDVPFVRQAENTCGAASLAMVLRYWKEDVTHDAIAARLSGHEQRGIPGSSLQAFARERGLMAIAYEGDTALLRDYVAKGRPLIVAWKQGARRFHDVVVVGHDDARGEFIVHDPAKGPSRRVKQKAFEKRWAGTGHWTLLVMPEP